MSDKSTNSLVAFVLLVMLVVMAVSFMMKPSTQVEVEVTGIEKDSSLPYPRLFFEISNKGSLEVTAVRASINDIDLPYTFGVSEEHPLKSNRTEEYRGYTAWYQPGGGVGGFIPDDGELYDVNIFLEDENGFVQVFEKSDKYIDKKFGSIASVVGFSSIHFRDVDLLSRNGNGSLSLRFRNEWYIGSPQTVERLEVLVGDKVVWSEDVSIRFGNYFVVLIDVPFEIEPEMFYDVTLIAYSDGGKVSTFTDSVLCQDYLIQ